MKIEEKVEELNKAVNGTLSITHYERWELHSYKNDSLFASDRDKNIRAKSFSSLIEKAYKNLKLPEIKEA